MAPVVGPDWSRYDLAHSNSSNRAWTRCNDGVGSMSNHEFFKDQETIMDAHEGRVYKMRAKSALNSAMHRSHGEFQKTWDRWRNNRKRLDSLRDGTAEFKVDYRKVFGTIAVQAVNLAVFISCIYNSAWIAAVILPLFIIIANFAYLALTQE